MEHPACVNVGAEDCAFAVERGRPVIRYLGQEYYVIGWYFGRGRDWRELHYILVQSPRVWRQETN